MRIALFCAVLTSSLALAQGTEAPAEEAAPKGAEATGPEAEAAKKLVNDYLVAVKAKKWADAKKMVHPQTMTAIAERKKRLGKEDHPMAPASFEKTEFWLKDFKVKGITNGSSGTFIVETAEDNFQVQEKGLVEGEMATYLVGKKDGKWFVVDKKRGETFTNDSIKLGYKGFFDKVQKAE